MQGWDPRIAALLHRLRRLSGNDSGPPEKIEEVRVIRLLALGFVAIAAFAPQIALAQVNIDQDKSPASIFSSDCSVCHKSIRGLANGRSRGDLTDYLAEHYTSSHQEAAALAAYVLAGGGGNGTPVPAREETQQPDRTRPADEPKTREARRPVKPGEEPAAEANPGATSEEYGKPARAEHSASAETGAATPEAKLPEAKPEGRPPEGKPPQGKPFQGKPSAAARSPRGRQRPTAVATVPKPAEPPAPAPVAAAPQASQTPEASPTPETTPAPSASGEATPQATSPEEASPAPTDDIPD